MCEQCLVNPLARFHAGLDQFVTAHGTTVWGHIGKWINEHEPEVGKGFLSQPRRSDAARLHVE